MFVREITWQGTMPDCRPRMLWQVLFDFYRERGGDLSRMDNILIDLRNCEEAMLEDKPVQYVFCMDKASGCTSWKDEANNYNMELFCVIWGFYYYLIVDVNEHGAKAREYVSSQPGENNAD